MKKNIVLFGGKDSKGKGNNVLNIYDLEELVWSKKELKEESNEIPKSRQCHTANVVGNFILIIGGWGAGKDMNVYQIDFDTQKC